MATAFVDALKAADALPAKVHRTDLIPHGILGLIDATIAFDLNGDLSVRAYTTKRIKDAMIDGLFRSPFRAHVRHRPKRAW